MASPTELLAEIDRIGRDSDRGGFSRHVFDHAEIELREWFTDRARARGLDITADRNGNIFAWWGPPGPGAVVTGSHLDSVPGGGAFDGPLGVACALSAVDLLRARGFGPRKPLALAVFAEEEGGRFGIPCLGSRLLAGSVDPDRVRALRGPDGRSFAEVMGAEGLRPEYLGKDDEVLSRIGRFVELHVEQGRGLIDSGDAVGVASSILAHGRWRFRFTGQGNHAGTTAIADRADPMLPASRLVTEARRIARSSGDARATVGKLLSNPNGTNVISSTVDMWLDARAHTDPATRELVAELSGCAESFAVEEGCRYVLTEESYSDRVDFDSALRDELVGLLDAPVLPTGAGHDAGALASSVPTAMLFVRNPTGISHAPEEHAEADDCAAGAEALARVLRSWTE